MNVSAYWNLFDSMQPYRDAVLEAQEALRKAQSAVQEAQTQLDEVTRSYKKIRKTRDLKLDGFSSNTWWNLCLDARKKRNRLNKQRKTCQQALGLTQKDLVRVSTENSPVLRDIIQGMINLYFPPQIRIDLTDDSLDGLSRDNPIIFN